MKRAPKKKQAKLLGLIALIAVILMVGLVSFRGTDFQGRLDLRPAADRDISALTGEAGSYSGEPVTGKVLTKAELAKLIVATLNVDTASYKDCAPDLLGQWYEPYACYMVSRNIMELASDGLFHGEKLMLRAEGAKIFALSFVKPADWYTGTQVIFKDVMPSDWFYVYTMSLAQKNLFDVEPILPGRTPSLTVDQSRGVFSPQTYLTQRAATIWAQNVKTNILP